MVDVGFRLDDLQPPQRKGQPQAAIENDDISQENRRRPPAAQMRPNRAHQNTFRDRAQIARPNTLECYLDRGINTMNLLFPNNPK